MELLFDKGDVVQYVGIDPLLSGKVGEVKDCSVVRSIVEFDEAIEGGHTCQGYTEDGKGAFVTNGNLIRLGGCS